MSDDNRDRSHWPKYLPYTPIAMGMISPEWTYMSHFFDEEEEEEKNEANLSNSSSTLTVPPLQTHAIQINFRSHSK